MIAGATPGSGANNLHTTPDLTGWQAYQHKTGTYGRVTKLFDPAAGYPNLWRTWAGSLGESFCQNNGRVSCMVLIVHNNVPSEAAYEALLRTLPAGQRIGFVYQSEAENTGSGITGAKFVADSHTISTNLNAALKALAAKPVTGNPAAFYTRANFPIVNSAYMAYYSQHPGSTAYLPAPGDVDAYGADLYHKGSATNKVCTQDPRYAGYLKAVTAKAGASAKLCFPEYGIDLAGCGGNDQTRADILKADMAAIGSRLTLWNYWFEVGNSGQQYLFSLPGPTAVEWKAIVG